MKLSIEQIRAASAQQFANACEDAADSTETAPSQLTERISTFAATLGGEPPVFVPVVPDDHGLFGWCVDGVREKNCLRRRLNRIRLGNLGMARRDADR